MPPVSIRLPLLLALLFAALPVFATPTVPPADPAPDTQADPEAADPEAPAQAPAAAEAPGPAPRVLLVTSHGEILLELDARAAPRTVENFLAYARDGHYNGTVFHRVIPGLLLQAG